MKIALYSFPNCHHAEQFKIFLANNKLPFKEIAVDSEEKRRDAQKAKQLPIINISFLKITYSSAIHIITSYQPNALQQLIEHIKKYNPKIEVPA